MTVNCLNANGFAYIVVSYVNVLHLTVGTVLHLTNLIGCLYCGLMASYVKMDLSVSSRDDYGV